MTFFEGKPLRIRRFDEDVALLVLDAEGATNRITPIVLDETDQALRQIAEADGLEMLIVCSGKASSFCHGLDPQWLAEHGSPEEMTALAELGQKVCQTLAALEIPSVAVIAGPCFGAGLELAIACDH